jgi:hypothetical protein
MTPHQRLLDEFQNVFFPSEAHAFWSEHQDALRGAGIILSYPGRSPFHDSVRPLFGTHAHVTSAFAYDGLFFLNDQINNDFAAGRERPFPITYLMSFDTNASSHLRALVGGRISPATNDLRGLLKHFQGGRLNWQIIPYLFENRHTLDRPEVLETILAAETLGAMDPDLFLRSGKFEPHLSARQLLAVATERLSHFRTSVITQQCRSYLEIWHLIHVVLLFMAILQLRWPGERHATMKLKEIIRFMDEKLNCMLMTMFALAAHWFHGDPRASILQPLQSRSPKVLIKARNIAWDIFHLIHLPTESAVPPPSASFLIPFFLTFDRCLNSVMEVCGVRSMLITRDRSMPFCVRATPVRPLLHELTADDEPFLARHLSVEANARRTEFLDSGKRPDLLALTAGLEKDLAHTNGI